MSLEEIIPSVLTPVQEKAVALLYDDAKAIIVTMKDSAKSNVVVTLSKLIGEVMTLVEAVSATKIPLSGIDKKKIVIEVIRKIILDVFEEEEVRAKITAVFDEIADPTIDMIITVSRGLQAAKKVEAEVVNKVESMCCPFLFKN